MKISFKLIGQVLLIVLCLQYNITFGDSAIPGVVIEFRKVTTDETRATLMSPEKGVFAFEPRDHYWVEHANEAKALLQNIDHTYVNQIPNGPWMMNIVFNAEFSRQLVEMSAKNINEPIAIVINGQLITVPILNENLAKHLNPEGQYQLTLPTHFQSQNDIEALMDRLHL